MPIHATLILSSVAGLIATIVVVVAI